MGSKVEKYSQQEEARLTARCFMQRQGVDYEQTFAPVSQMSSMRVFLSLVVVLNLHTYQLDIKTAFLNAPLEEVLEYTRHYFLRTLCIEIILFL